MRRKDKYVLNGAILGATVFSITDIVLQWIEHRNTNRNFTWENYDGTRTLEKAAFGGVIGSSLGYLTYQFRISEEAKLPFNSDSYLKKLLTKEKLKGDPTTLRKVHLVRNRVKQFLWEKFKAQLVQFPEDAGSFYKHTAIISKFDLDIILPFKRDSFHTLKEMYYSVYNAIGEEFGMEVRITKETKAIGLSVNYKGDLIHFDIVPGREINDYKVDRDLNLYVKPNWTWQKGGQFKTNSRIQKNNTVNRPRARAVIKLLKKYRLINGLNLPSMIVEQYTINALSEGQFGTSYSMTENLLNTMKFIAKKITQQRLIDTANSNNNLHEKMSTSDRFRIASLLENDIARIEQRPTYIREIFGV